MTAPIDIKTREPFDSNRNRRSLFVDSTFDLPAPHEDLTGEVWDPNETHEPARRIDWPAALCGAVLLIIGFFAWIAV